MNAQDPIQAFYRNNPRMVSSPFGGVDGVNEELFLRVMDRLEISLDGKGVLDVGCGRGFLADIVTQHGGHYTGVDFVVSRGGFPLAQSDAAALPFPDAHFALLFCIDASEHFHNSAAAAAEFFRVLKPGGTFFLSAPNYGNIAGLVKRVYEGVGWYAKDTWAPFGRWTPQELEQPLTPGFVRRLYTDAGFTRINTLGHGPEVGLGLFPWIDHPKMPEAIQFRLQKLFKHIGPPIANACPRASLHIFWRIDKE